MNHETQIALKNNLIGFSICSLLFSEWINEEIKKR